LKVKLGGSDGSKRTGQRNDKEIYCFRAIGMSRDAKARWRRDSLTPDRGVGGVGLSGRGLSTNQ